jgi:two-component system OmpR family sensor kinase
MLFVPAFYLTLEREFLQGVDRQLIPITDQAVASLKENPRVVQGLNGTAPGGGDLSAPWTRGIVDDLDRWASSDVILQLMDTNGKVVAFSSKSRVSAMPVPGNAIAAAWWGNHANFSAIVEGTRYRSVMAAIPGDNAPRGFVLAARSLAHEDAALQRLRNLLIAGASVGLLLVAGVGWFVTGRGLHPIEEIQRTVRSIALSQGFGRRLKVDDSRDEIGRLAATLNEMLASLDAAYSAQRRFVADASHELRSPLTSIRSNIEILQRALDAPKEDRAEALSDVAAEVDRMTKLTNDLLLLARADAGHRIEMSRVALDELVQEVYRQFNSQTNGVTLKLGERSRVDVLGNTTWLKQLLVILLDNALKYTPRGGSVTLGLEAQDGNAVIAVQDTGIGIPPEDLPHIFERFYRADKARFRNEGGAGLGLAVARWIVHEHGGEIEAKSKVGKGATFTVKIPVY